jgi:hypothetical protein
VLNKKATELQKRPWLGRFTKSGYHLPADALREGTETPKPFGMANMRTWCLEKVLFICSTSPLIYSGANRYRDITIIFKVRSSIQKALRQN